MIYAFWYFYGDGASKLSPQNRYLFNMEISVGSAYRLEFGDNFIIETLGQPIEHGPSYARVRVSPARVRFVGGEIGDRTVNAEILYLNGIRRLRIWAAEGVALSGLAVGVTFEDIVAKINPLIIQAPHRGNLEAQFLKAGVKKNVLSNVLRLPGNKNIDVI